MPSLYQTPIAHDHAKGRYAFVSLGCPKNLVDSERMLGMLQLEGYELVDDPKGADFAIVNTCGFIEQARQESYGVIDEMLELKRRGDLRGVIVSGCLAERQKELLLEERPEIDQLVGVFGREEVTKVADRLLGGLQEQRTLFQPAPANPLPDSNRLRITPRHFAYLKIAEGCDRLCTFCAIPKMRGKHASKPIETIVAEARALVADGVRELVIVSQDTTYYGIDRYGKPRLAALLGELDQIDGLDWIRLMYLYPEHLNDALIGQIASSNHVIPYLDMPIQHINEKILQRMQRRVGRTETLDLLAKLRDSIPNLVLRTTLITGFPGETDADADELVEFVQNQRFERLGAFTFSREPGTPADRLSGHVPEEVMQQRRDRIMSEQQQIAFDWNEAQIGKKIDVLIDMPVTSSPFGNGGPNGKNPDGKNPVKLGEGPTGPGPGEAGGEIAAWIGRSWADAPDIDGVVYVTGSPEGAGAGLQAGKMVRCEVVAHQDYDLIAVAI